jgi:hypothetical protein
VAELVGVSLDEAEAEDSFSMLPALVGAGSTGARAEGAVRTALVSDSGGLRNSPVGDFAIREGRWKLVILARDEAGALEERRFPVPDALDGTLLFDLEADPAEQVNCIEENPDVVARLLDLLDQTRARGARFL